MVERMAFNSELVAKVIQDTQKLGNLKQKIGNLRYRVERMPELRLPKSHPDYETFGEKIGLTGSEVQHLLMEIIANPDEHQLDAIKKMLMVAKLRNPAVLDGYRSQVQRAHELYENDFKQYTEAKDKVATYQAELDTLVGEKFLDLREEWATYIDSISLYVMARDNKHVALEGDELLFFNLLNKHSKHVQISDTADSLGNPTEPGIIGADWVKLRNGLNIEHINTILREWSKILNQKAEADATTNAG